MATVSVSDEDGQLMVTVDGGEPQPVQNAEEACSIIEQTFGQPDADEGMQEEQMAAGYTGIRGGGLNG